MLAGFPDTTLQDLFLWGLAKSNGFKTSVSSKTEIKKVAIAMRSSSGQTIKRKRKAIAFLLPQHTFPCAKECR